MSATSPTSGLSTPVHLSSGSVHSLINEGVPNHYTEQLDFDEAIDVCDHVTTTRGGVFDHVTPQRMKLSLSDDSNEEASTAEEGRDSVPNYESTTTDNIMESLEPIDYIESNPRLSSEIRYHANGPMVGNRGNGAAPSPPDHRYENWSVLEGIDDGSKKSERVHVSRKLN